MIVVVGLAFEARIAAGPGVRVVRRSDDDLAKTLSRALMPDCRGIVSFGVCGGLAPDLKPGDVVVASAILSGQGRIATDGPWSRRLLDRLPAPAHGLLLGVPAPVADPALKRTLHEETGAIAVDMESHVVADVAAACGLPMVAIRVVTDPAQRTIPHAALAAMGQNGSIDVIAMARSLLRRPRQVTGLMRTALDARLAHLALRRHRAALGPSLGSPYHHAAGAGLAPLATMEALQPAE